MNYLKQERGSILVLSVILLPILFAFLGFGYDFGNIYMHKSRLQNVADAAALAGARAYLDSQATDNKDAVDGTVDRANGKLKADSTATYPTGRNTPDVYAVGDAQKTKNRDYSNHKAADKAADAYIYHNIINLGSKVKTDKWSHYAINSDGTDPKTFYRIGLYEEVPLYFLPIIKSIGKTQIVRAGAIALVVPGTTTQTHGSGGSTTTITNPSIFDNLFTFSEWLFTENQTIKNAGNEDNNTIVHSSFTGDIVYTHLNNMADTASSQYSGSIQPNSFFTMATDNGGIDTYAYNHLYEDAMGTNIASGAGGTINDPYINTFYDTKAYLSAFESKLDSYHNDVVYLDSKVLLNASDINNENSYIYAPQAQKDKDGNLMYRFTYSGKTITYSKDTNKDINSNDRYYYYDENDKKVYFYRENYGNKVVRVAKYAGSGSFSDNQYHWYNGDYVLDANGNVIYLQINNGEVFFAKEENGVKKYIAKFDMDSTNCYYTDTNTNETIAINYIAINQVDMENESNRIVSGGQKTNVLHVPLEWKQNAIGAGIQYHQNLTITMDEALTGDDINEPVYILVEGINRVEIKGSADMTTGRPLIIVFLSAGTTQIEYNFNGHFKGTIYAPISTFEQVQGSGSFTGNLIAKTIYIQDGSEINFVQENHLEKIKYNYIADTEKGDYVYDNGAWRKVDVGKGTHRRETVYKFVAATDGNGDFVQDAEGGYIDANGVRWRKVDKGTGTHTGEFDYLYKDDEVKLVSDATKDKIANANKIANLTEDVKKDIYTKLGLSEAEMAAMASNPNWYNEQTFARKKLLYSKWKTLYDNPDYASIRDFLWPWNEHFDIYAGEDTSDITDEVLRLINFRTDFQEKNPDGSDNTGEKNPFIYLSLEKENAY